VIYKISPNNNPHPASIRLRVLPIGLILDRLHTVKIGKLIIPSLVPHPAPPYILPVILLLILRLDRVSQVLVLVGTCPGVFPPWYNVLAFVVFVPRVLLRVVVFLAVLSIGILLRVVRGAWLHLHGLLVDQVCGWLRQEDGGEHGRCRDAALAQHVVIVYGVLILLCSCGLLSEILVWKLLAVELDEVLLPDVDDLVCYSLLFTLTCDSS